MSTSNNYGAPGATMTSTDDSLQVQFDRATSGVSRAIAMVNSRLEAINLNVRTNYGTQIVLDLPGYTAADIPADNNNLYVLDVNLNSEQLLSGPPPGQYVLDPTLRPEQFFNNPLATTWTPEQYADFVQQVREAQQLVQIQQTLTAASNAVHAGATEAVAESLVNAINYLPLMQDIKGALASVAESVSALAAEYHDIPILSDLATFTNNSLQDVSNAIDNAVGEVAQAIADAGVDFIGNLITDFSDTISSLMSGDSLDFSLDNLLPMLSDIFPVSFGALWEKIKKLVNMLYDMVMKSKVVAEITKLYTNLAVYCAEPPPPSKLAESLIDTVKDYLIDIFDSFVNSGMLKLIVKNILMSLFAKMLGYNDGSYSIGSVSGSTTYEVGFNDTDTFVKAPKSPPKTQPAVAATSFQEARKFYEELIQTLTDIDPTLADVLNKDFVYTEQADELDSTVYPFNFNYTPKAKSTGNACVALPGSLGITKYNYRNFKVVLGPYVGTFKSIMEDSRSYYDFGKPNFSSVTGNQCIVYGLTKNKKNVVTETQRMLWDIPLINKPCFCKGSVPEAESTSEISRERIQSYYTSISQNLVSGYGSSTHINWKQYSHIAKVVSSSVCPATVRISVDLTSQPSAATSVRAVTVTT